MADRVFEFTLWLADDPRDLVDWSNALYDAGADDSSPGVHCGKLYAAFDREAESLEVAVGTAIRDVQAAGLTVLRCEIEADHLAGFVRA